SLASPVLHSFPTRRSSDLVGDVAIPMVVNAAPTIVTNMTGFLIIRRGSSFRNESAMAGPTMFQPKREGDFWVIVFRSKEFPLQGQEVLDNRAERQRW